MELNLKCDQEDGIEIYFEDNSDDNLYWMCGLSKRVRMTPKIALTVECRVLRRGTLAEASYRSGDVKEFGLDILALSYLLSVSSGDTLSRQLDI